MAAMISWKAFMFSSVPLLLDPGALNEAIASGASFEWFLLLSPTAGDAFTQRDCKCSFRERERRWLHLLVVVLASLQSPRLTIITVMVDCCLCCYC